MTICAGPLRNVVTALTDDFGWSCSEPIPGVAAVSTGRHYSDSEPVEVFIRHSAGILILSDNGETMNRLLDGGFDPEDLAHLSLWRETLHEFRLGVSDGIIASTAGTDRAPAAIARFADALLGLDTLRLVSLPAVTRRRTFANKVEEYLRARLSVDAVERNPSLTVVDDDDEIVVRPTFRVIAKRGPVYIQTSAATSGTQNYEHAFFTFSMAGRAGVPIENRLAIFGGSHKRWRHARLRLLTEHANVALWEYRAELEAFLDGRTTESRLLIPHGS